jgi:hypothetical protein
MPDEWKMKLDDDGHVVLNDSKPIYIDPDGKEVTLDPVGMYDKIIVLGKENKTRREESTGLQAKVKLFDGIEDLDKYKADADEALETVKNFNEKDWLKADKVEKLKADMKTAYDEQETNLRKSFGLKEEELSTVITRKDIQIRSLMVSNRFATSPFFSGTNPKTTLPPEIAETYFGKHFKVEEDKTTGALNLAAYHSNGDPVYSRQNPGEIANFDEAMVAIFDQYPGKDQLIRASGGGSGAGGGSGGKDDDEGQDIKALEKQYAEAQKTGDAKAMVAIKNKLFKARQEAQGQRAAA